MKRIVSLLLVILCIISMAGCSKLSKLTDTEKPSVDAGNNDIHADKEIAKKNSYNFLVLGHDRAASLTDVMMLVNYDTDSGKMTITQIPRDTYVEFSDGAYRKINGLYNYCISEAKEQGVADTKKEGCRMTADHLEKALGIKIHYSAVMDLEGFGSIVDSIGGVYMYVPYSMLYSDPSQNLYISLLEGYQTLDGKKAEQFVRFRSGYVMADLARGDAQKMFMTAFVEAVKKNISVSSVSGIANAILDNVKTDMTLSEIVDIGKNFVNIQLSDITMLTLPGEACMSDSGASFYVINRESAAMLLDESYNIFEEDIEIESFDKAGMFVNENDGNMLEIYDKPADEFSYEKHNAQDVSDKDIPIQLK
ncbi:MAG: LytR family transcriptional regulator [Ruminococcaceae bacterium]|nr:LytR family transcriptional regulator [Oscillospiraceae bacterium]